MNKEKLENDWLKISKYVWIEIFYYLSVNDLVNCAFVCKKLKEYSYHNNLWRR